MKSDANQYTHRRPKRSVRLVTFGEWLKDMRGDMPQDRLAERADVSRGYITSIESNKRTPSIANVIALAKGVHCHPLEGLAALAGKEYLAEARSLLGATGKYQIGPASEIIILDDEEIELIRFYRTLTKEKRDWLKQAMGILKSAHGKDAGAEQSINALGSVKWTSKKLGRKKPSKDRKIS